MSRWLGEAGSGMALAKGKLIDGTRSVESNKKIS